MIVLLGASTRFAPTSVFLALWVRIAGADALAGPARSACASGTASAPRTSCFLRRLARRTWRYFDDLVNAETNWLPPDNSQLALRVEVAQRTSPTNIGLWLTSALAARDFGYLTADDFLNRCAQTMATLDRLERYEGHLLNWYDTDTLEPLTPRYVSTVDSGNLLASLWVFERGCQDLLARSAARPRLLYAASPIPWASCARRLRPRSVDAARRRSRRCGGLLRGKSGRP